MHSLLEALLAAADGRFPAVDGRVDVVVPLDGDHHADQVAPGNAASLRAFLSCGFVPIGAEVLLRPATK